MSQERHQTRFYECSRHGRKLQRTCAECCEETGFTAEQWGYREAKERGVVLPLALCHHGNAGRCPAGCSSGLAVAKDGE